MNHVENNKALFRHDFLKKIAFYLNNAVKLSNLAERLNQIVGTFKV